MIFGWIRLAAFAFVGMTIAFLIMRLYLRSTRREALEKRFDAGGVPGNRAHFIEMGLRRFDKGLHKKLLWLIYILPTVACLVTIYVLNF